MSLDTRYMARIWSISMSTEVMAIVALALPLIAAIVTAALQYQKLPFLNRGTEYSGYFADAGGLFTGAGVEVSGYPVGKVTSITLDGPQVLIRFTIANNIHLGERTEAAIRTKSLLGTKVLNVTPAGDNGLTGPIPLVRTTSPYQLPDALAEKVESQNGNEKCQRWVESSPGIGVCKLAHITQ